MESQPLPEIPSSCHCEFDAVNKILLMRVEGGITEKSAIEIYSAIRKRSSEVDASATITDLSSVTEFDVSNYLIRHLASRDPVGDPARPRFIIAPKTFVYGMSRMFQIIAEPKNPLRQVVHNLDEALAALGVQSPHFEPLE